MPVISGGGGGGGIGAVLFTQTLSGSAANIDTGAGGFSGGKSVLLAFAYLRGTQAAASVNCQVTFNNDGTAIYDYMVAGGQNATPTAGNSIAGAAWLPAVCAGSNAAGSFSAVTIIMPQYAATTGHKIANVISGLPDATAANMIEQTLQGRYRSTSAVSRITLTPSAGQWAAGSSLLVVAF